MAPNGLNAVRQPEASLVRSWAAKSPCDAEAFAFVLGGR